MRLNSQLVILFFAFIAIELIGSLSYLYATRQTSILSFFMTFSLFKSLIGLIAFFHEQLPNKITR